MTRIILGSLCCLILGAFLFPAGADAAQAKKDTVTVEKVQYGGWNNCIRMINGIVELIATTDVGPRIIKYSFVGKENEFYEIPETLGKTGFPEWVPFGGHRLWIAPEEKPKTYFPDSTPITYEIKGDTLTLVQPVENTTNIQKEMIITMKPDSSHVTVMHKLTNKGKTAMYLAPWSITQMQSGGKALFPQEDYAPHPDSPEGKALKVDTSFYLPIRTYALWSYTDLADPRFKISGKYMLLHQDPKMGKPQKVGLSNRKGWGAYLRNGHMFLKKAVFDLKGMYPDAGSSFESYVDGNMLEMETLGPLVTLEPGKFVSHREDWYLFDNVNPDETDASIDEVVQKYVK